MGCINKEDPEACIYYCDEIATNLGFTDQERWDCYSLKKVPKRLYGRPMCEKQNPNYLATVDTKTNFL